ncbi:MAG TPA: ABC transporter permease subunit [Vicinamibacteria bacterium]|nr:ABC transporter permease subunit [Vicinamibacteria bacterium]
MASTTPDAAPALKVRQRIQAASGRIRTLKRIDRTAAGLIRLGGVGIVISVMGILVFILSEAWPLFRPTRGELVATVPLPQEPPASPAPGTTPGAPAATPAPAAMPTPVATPAAGPAGTSAPPVLAMGVDEYQMYFYAIRAQPRLEFFRLADGSWVRDVPVAGLEGADVTAASSNLQGDRLAVATADGRAGLLQVAFRPRYTEQTLADLDIEVVQTGPVQVDSARRPLRQVAYAEVEPGRPVVAAVVGDDEIVLWSRDDDEGGESTASLRTSAGERVTAVALGGGRLLAGTDRGNVHEWALAGGEARLQSISPVGAPVTALGWVLGEVTFLVGTAQGGVSAWFRARLRDDDDEPRTVRGHVFDPQPSAIRAIAPSTRDKSFLTVGEEGTVWLRHVTSERTLVRLGGVRGPTAAVMTPRGDGALVAQLDGKLARFALANPHPEISWRTLFGRVWYEGYGRPEYVWQSTGATNDFEAKFSLVPLVFGTLKGTFYALLFAIPLAVLGALYTSQFVHPSIRARIKPTVEIMAALPSVVIGFVAGLYLAPLIERYVVAVVLMMVLVPLCGTAGVLLWARLPEKFARRLKAGMELALILPAALLGGWISVQVAPLVEAALFRGDFRLWLSTVAGLTYDQRNSLVVGLAMGFAVIPIIFTIADDAFSSVPSSLTAGSLALGASRWQTAVRVVLPTASPGVFSAIMIGFGRAVGETMIVLMATGNTPVLDWSIFNGMRTLSANIAVEIPEAPHGGTLYRVLFLAAGLLFAMTFLVNTVAEVIRQRLREKYRAL